MYDTLSLLIVRLCVCAAGELQREEDVLEWLVQNKSTGDEDDVIEDVTSKTLATLISNIDNLVVLFCMYASKSINTLDSKLSHCLQMIMATMIR